MNFLSLSKLLPLLLTVIPLPTVQYLFLKEDSLDFQYFIQDCFICRPSDSTVSEDAGLEPRGGILGGNPDRSLKGAQV